MKKQTKKKPAVKTKQQLEEELAHSKHVIERYGLSDEQKTAEINRLYAVERKLGDLLSTSQKNENALAAQLDKSSTERFNVARDLELYKKDAQTLRQALEELRVADIKHVEEVARLRNENDEKSGRIIRMMREIESMKKGQPSTDELLKKLSDPDVERGLLSLTARLEAKAVRGNHDIVIELREKIQQKDNEIARLRAGIEALT